MSEQSAVTGSCLCGAVKFEITPPSTAFRYCHCTRCHKATGAAHAANMFVPAGLAGFASPRFVPATCRTRQCLFQG